MILVTGGTGLVGSHLLYELTRNHDKVRAIHRPGSNLHAVLSVFSMYSENAANLYEKIEWTEADMGDPESLQTALHGIRQVYHCAAIVSFDPGEKEAMIRANVEGTANIVNACLEEGIDKLCYVSSTAALGSAAAGTLITEDLVWSASSHRSAYSISKHRSEMEVWRGIAEGMDAVIVNPSIIIGPGEWERSSSRLFSVVWKGMKYYTEGVTGYVDVRDVITAMTGLMSSGISGERFTVSAENLSYHQVLEMIAEKLGKQAPSVHAGTLIISLAWRLDWLKHKITGQKRSITKEAVRSSKQQSYFSNEKLSAAINLKYKTISDSIGDTAVIFLSQASHQ